MRVKNSKKNCIEFKLSSSVLSVKFVEYTRTGYKSIL